MKIYNDRVNTSFQHNKKPRHNEYCALLSVILLASIFVNLDKKYYPQMFLEECKYAVKNVKIVNTMKTQN